MKIRLLTRGEVQQALSMPRAIELMADAFRALSEGSVQAPVRTNVSNGIGTMLYKPALMPSANLFGLKAVSVFPENKKHGLPVTTGLMLVNDAKTGLPLALMDAEYLTALRTGAASGLATKLLASPNTETAALFGTGGQAACQLQALRLVLSLKTIHVFSRDPAKAEQFCATHSSSAKDCRLVPGTDLAVLSECGVITTATTGKSPVFHDDQIAAGTHINGIGSFTPDSAEVPAETVFRASVFVDQRDAAMTEAGDLVQPIRNGLLPPAFSPAELGEVLLGKRPGRTNPNEITFFKSVGNAAQDIVCAAEILTVANRQNLGLVFRF